MSDVRLYYEEVLRDMKREVDESEGRTIKKLIDEHMAVAKIQAVGERYYNERHDIIDLEPKTDAYGNIDESKPDWRMIANFHSNQVDQKVGYLIAEPINFKADKPILEKIGEVLNDEFDDLMNDLLTAASNKGIEWLHIYYNEEGDLKLMQVPAEQIVPVYDERGNLELIIRHYALNDKNKAEVWSPNEVSYWQENGGEYIPDYYYGESHIMTHYSDESWGRIPFIPFRNNSYEKGDIWKYKTQIDAFNKRLSDIQNTFDESTEIIFALRGYRGEGLAEFMKNLKHYKAISLGSDGGIDTLSVKIPIEETKQYLDMLKDMIIDLGRGVDFNSNKFGNSPSGVALKILYSGLDIKAKQLERKTRVALKELLWFIFKAKGIEGNHEDIEMTFRYNKLKNDLEDAQIAGMSKGIISDETILANHPWVDDMQGEQERLQAQELSLNSRLPEIKVGVEDEPGTD